MYQFPSISRYTATSDLPSPSKSDVLILWIPDDEKLAVSLTGPFIVTCAGFVVPVYEPVPVPAQPVKADPAFAMAEIFTTCPELKKPLAGPTVPPAPAAIVNWNCVVKFAV